MLEKMSETFDNLILKFPILWDSKHFNFRNRYLTRQAKLELLHLCNYHAKSHFTLQWLNTKIKLFRCRLYRQRKNTKITIHNSDGTNSDSEPNYSGGNARRGIYASVEIELPIQSLHPDPEYLSWSTQIDHEQWLAGVSQQEVQPGPSKTLDPTTTLGAAYNTNSNAFEEQVPLISIVIEQCRFCGEFSKDCVAVSGNMPYLAHNKTTLVLNDTSVQLDFNDGSLPKTVCRDCDAKLQEIADFFKVVKAAQDTLMNVAEERAEYAETRVGFEVAKAEETVDTETDTLVIKSEYDSEQEERDDDKEDKEGIVDSLTIGETVFVKKTVTHKRKSHTVTAKPKKLKTKKCDDELTIDEEGKGQSEVSDYVKPSALELAKSALVFELTGEGTNEHQGYRSDR